MMSTNVGDSPQVHAFKQNLYYAYYLPGEIPDNPYRLHYKDDHMTEEQKVFFDKIKEDKGRVNDYYFVDAIVKLRRVRLREFLDFHYDQYTALKKDFLLHTKDLITPGLFHRWTRDIILDWIELKLKELPKPENQVTSDLLLQKTGKKKHSPRLQQPELVMLARLLWESDFRSEHTTQGEIAEAMHIISGYSKNSIAGDFSTSKNEKSYFTDQQRAKVRIALLNMASAVEKC